MNTRREELCEKFARKAAKSTRFINWLINTVQPTMNTRQHIQTQSKFLPVQTRTNRFKNSVEPYLTGIQYEVSSNYSETLLAL